MNSEKKYRIYFPKGNCLKDVQSRDTVSPKGMEEIDVITICSRIVRDIHLTDHDDDVSISSLFNLCYAAVSK